MNPGLTSLTWGSKGITEYFVKECRRHSHDVQSTVTQFVESSSTIQRSMKAMADTLLWKVENKKVYDLDEFERAQSEYRIVAQDKLLNAYESIKNILCGMYEIFRNDGGDVYSHWVKYVDVVKRASRSRIHRG